MKIVTLSILLLSAFAAHCDIDNIIQSSNKTPWLVNQTVGVRGGIIIRTGTTVDVTQAPYGVDNTGVTNAATGIASAIAAAGSNTVIYIPEGVYNITNGLTLNKSGITLRGAGSNTVLFGHLIFGHASSGDTVYYVTNTGGGGVKATTNATLMSTLDRYGNTIRAGDYFMFSAENEYHPYWQVISTANYRRLLRQVVIMDSISGSNITFSPPLVWNFTNNPTMDTMSLASAGAGFRPYLRSGLESFTICSTNAGRWDPYDRNITMQGMAESWITNVNSVQAANYCLTIDDVVHCTVTSSRFALTGAGPSHSGIIVEGASGCLFENNIFADLGTTGFMFNTGFAGNAVFGNFVTNCSFPISSHNVHPMMNLFEANICNYIMMDGYFGSASHNTLFRNQMHSGGQFKRFTTYMQCVGNVVGRTNLQYQWEREESGHNSEPYGVWSMGYPNLGNTGYNDISPPVAWNFPGRTVNSFTVGTYTNGVFTFTGDYGPTNVLWTNMGVGTFTNIPAPVVAGYPIIFQDGSNTNFYYGATSSVPVLTTGAGTPSNVTLNVYVYVTNGSTLYIAGANAYQWLQQSNKYTHTFHGNGVYTNNPPNGSVTVVWDAGIADHDVPDSILYPSGAPGWWGTNRWPGIDPEASPVAAAIPSLQTYYGIDNGSTLGPIAPSDLVATEASATQVNLAWSDNSSDEDGFEVSVDTSASFGSEQITGGIAANAESFGVTSLVTDTLYYFRVRSTNSSGASNWSSSDSATPTSGGTTLVPSRTGPGIPMRGRSR